MEISYAHAPVPVRADIPAAHSKIWQKLAEPGTWWTGAERVAIAAEVRKAYQCQFCTVRKTAISPSAIEGKHDTEGVLPEVVVEMIHQITTDPGRLSKQWFDRLVSHGLQDTHYVEALGVLVRTISIDTFCRAIDVPLHPLPSPVAGAPSHCRPSMAQHNGEWVPMFPAGEMNGPAAELYGGRAASPVLRALSLVPDEVRLSIFTLLPAQYMDPFQVRDPQADPGRAINRPQIELLAARVSSLNQCFYWTTGHVAMLRASSQTQNLADDLDLTAVIDSTKDSGLPHGALLIAFVDAVLGKDGAALNAARNALLKESGPEALVDAAGVIATFMQMVRIADATGIAIDTAILEKTQEVRETLGINTFASAQNTLGPNA